MTLTEFERLLDACLDASGALALGTTASSDDYEQLANKAIAARRAVIDAVKEHLT